MIAYFTIALFSLIAGIITGWVFTRIKFKTGIESLAEKNTEATGTIGNLQAQVETLRSGMQSESTLKTRAESDLKNSMERISELQNDCRELTQLRDLYSAMKTKH